MLICWKIIVQIGSENCKNLVKRKTRRKTTKKAKEKWYYKLVKTRVVSHKQIQKVVFVCLERLFQSVKMVFVVAKSK